MKTTTWRALSILIACLMGCIMFLSVKMGGCPGTIATADGGTVPMHCRYTFVAVGWIGLAGLIATVVEMVLCAPTKGGRRAAALITWATLLAVVLVVSPAGIGLCANAAMHCHFTARGVYAVSAIIAVLALIQLIFSDPDKADLPKKSL